MMLKILEFEARIDGEGHPVSFVTVDDLKSWLRKNRDRTTSAGLGISDVGRSLINGLLHEIEDAEQGGA